MSLKRGGQLLDVTTSMTRSVDNLDEGGGPTFALRAINGAAPPTSSPNGGNGGAVAPFSSPTSSGSAVAGISEEAAEALTALQSPSTELWKARRPLLVLSDEAFQ